MPEGARASEDRGAWLKAGAARVRAHRRFWSPNYMFLDAVWGHSHPHEVGGAQRRARRLFLRVLYFVFVFSLGGPTPSEAAGGHPLTQRSKTLGPSEAPGGKDEISEVKLWTPLQGGLPVGAGRGDTGGNR